MKDFNAQFTYKGKRYVISYKAKSLEHARTIFPIKLAHQIGNVNEVKDVDVYRGRPLFFGLG